MKCFGRCLTAMTSWVVVVGHRFFWFAWGWMVEIVRLQRHAQVNVCGCQGDACYGRFFSSKVVPATVYV